MSITDIINKLERELDYMEDHVDVLNGIGEIDGIDPELAPDLAKGLKIMRETVEELEDVSGKIEELL